MKTLNFDFDNVPGISLIYAIPTSSFHQCIINPFDGTGSLSLVNSTDIIDIPVYIGDKFNFNEVQQFTEGGNCWDVNISGIIPKRCALNEKTIHILERGEWFVLCRDANGTITLAGSLDVPLKFTHSRTTGASGDMNGSKFSFTSCQSAPSVILTELPTVS